ncbi:hypothetical protein ES703_62076 [subsurface metagenome]
MSADNRFESMLGNQPGGIVNIRADPGMPCLNDINTHLVEQLSDSQFNMAVKEYSGGLFTFSQGAVKYLNHFSRCYFFMRPCICQDLLVSVVRQAMMP